MLRSLLGYAEMQLISDLAVAESARFGNGLGWKHISDGLAGANYAVDAFHAGPLQFEAYIA